MPFTITLPNGDTISYPDGVPQEAIRADIEQKIARGELPDPRLGDPMQEGTSQPIQVGPDAERNALRTGLKMTELASGFLPGGPLVRIPAAAIAGLLTGALTGEDEGEGLERGAWQGGLQATGEFLPPGINKGFQGAGLLLGGRSKDLAKTAATFAKERLPIGATGRMAARRKGLNPQLKELEGAIPGPVDIQGSVYGATDDLRRGAANTANPDTLSRQYLNQEEEFLREVAANRTSRGLHPTELSGRELGNLARGVQRQSQKVYTRAAKPGAPPVSEADDAIAQGRAAIARGLVNTKHGLSQPVADLDKRLSGIHNMEQASNAMGGGRVFTKPGTMLARGALGGIATGVPSYFSGDTSSTVRNTGLGAALGMLLLAPSTMSRAGIYSDLFGTALPSILRAEDVISGMGDDQEGANLISILEALQQEPPQ